MNRIVRQHYPVSKHPEGLQAGFAGTDEVRVTTDSVRNPAAMQLHRPAMLDERFAMGRPGFSNVLLETATLHQTHTPKLPDAIHIATAVQAGCRSMVSSDRDTNRLPRSIKRVLPNQQGVSRMIEALRG